MVGGGLMFGASCEGRLLRFSAGVHSILGTSAKSASDRIPRLRSRGGRGGPSSRDSFCSAPLHGFDRQDARRSTVHTVFRLLVLAAVGGSFRLLYGSITNNIRVTIIRSTRSDSICHSKAYEIDSYGGCALLWVPAKYAGLNAG